MCTWGTEKTIQITQTITVDACIADEIVALNAAGVRTINSCCGHGKGPAVALIMGSSTDKARALGYEPTLSGGTSYDYWEIRIGEGRMPRANCAGHGDACMCDDCKLRSLELWSDAREATDRKARPEEVDRSQLLGELGCRNLGELAALVDELGQQRKEERQTMDSNGQMYAAMPEVRTAIEKMFADKTEKVLDSADAPEDSIDLSGHVATILAKRNRRFRRAYYAERRAGKSEAEALALAEQS